MLETTKGKSTQKNVALVYGILPQIPAMRWNTMLPIKMLTGFQIRLAGHGECPSLTRTNFLLLQARLLRPEFQIPSISNFVLTSTMKSQDKCAHGHVRHNCFVQTRQNNRHLETNPYARTHTSRTPVHTAHATIDGAGHRTRKTTSPHATTGHRPPQNAHNLGLYKNHSALQAPPHTAHNLIQHVLPGRRALSRDAREKGRGGRGLQFWSGLQTSLDPVPPVRTPCVHA